MFAQSYCICVLLLNEGLCAGSCRLPMSNMCLFASHVLDQTHLHTFDDRSNVKPVSVRDESAKSTCLSLLPSVDLVSPGPEADIFSFLLASWPPSWPCPGPLAEAPYYLLPRELCVQRVNTAWLVEQGSNLLLTLTHASTDAHKTHTQSHDCPRRLAEMFTVLQSVHPVEWRAMVRETNRQRRP